LPFEFYHRNFPWQYFLGGIKRRSVEASPVVPRAGSWPGGPVMRHGNGDKMIIARLSRNSHWVHWSCRDDADNGSIIDFLQNRRRGSLGAIRLVLRGWSGSSPAFPARPSPDRFGREAIGTEKDRGQVMVAFVGMKIAVAHPYPAMNGKSRRRCSPRSGPPARCGLMATAKVLADIHRR